MVGQDENLIAQDLPGPVPQPLPHEKDLQDAQVMGRLVFLEVGIQLVLVEKWGF